MHSTKTKTFIGTQESVYRDSPVGKLEEGVLVKNMLIPHQQGFNSDSKTCLPVAVHYLPAPAFEQGVVVAMPTFSHSAAVATPFAGVVGINNVESDIFIKAPALEGSFEQVKS